MSLGVNYFSDKESMAVTNSYYCNHIKYLPRGMKLFLYSLVCLLASTSLFARSNSKDNGATPSQVIEITKRKYLLLTKKNNGGSFRILPGEILCVRFEDAETCAAHNQPDAPFVKKTSSYSFISASSQKCLQLEKELFGYTPEENLSATASSISCLMLKATPQNKKVEHEWVFEAKAAGKTKLHFKHFQQEVGYNGVASSPRSTFVEPISFTITTEALE